MARPILREAEAQQSTFTFGDFPGVLSPGRGDEAARLRCQIVINMSDRYTGEKLSLSIPLETDESDHVIPWLEGALKHERVQGDVKTFVKGRNG